MFSKIWFFRLTLQEKHWTQKLFERLTILWMLWMPMEETIWRPMHHICLRITLCVWLHQLDSSIRIPFFEFFWFLSWAEFCLHFVSWMRSEGALPQKRNSRQSRILLLLSTNRVNSVWRILESILSASRTKDKSGVRWTCHSYSWF